MTLFRQAVRQLNGQVQHLLIEYQKTKANDDLVDLVFTCLDRILLWANSTTKELRDANRSNREFAARLAMTSGETVTFNDSVEQKSLNQDLEKRKKAQELLEGIKSSPLPFVEQALQLAKAEQEWFPL